jgi:eukaryotic-like serine/threonine-protein kinase
MRCISMLWIFLLCAPLACQRTSSVGDDSETEGTVPTSDSASLNPESDSESDTDTSTADHDTQTDTGSDTEPLPDPVENEWIFIEGGSFEMGYDGISDVYKPVHIVTVPSFDIQKTEVTVHQYRQCVNDEVCPEPHQSERECTNPNYNNWLVSDRVDFPINCIDHFQATEYCNWIGGRLPSEAEWEYAARGGGQDFLYPWGNDTPDCDLVAASGEYVIGLPVCWSNGALPVCSKPMGNSFHDLCDMSGNYREWVADQVQVAWGYEGAPSDGSAWIKDSQIAIVRGSDAFYEDETHRVYLRLSYEANSAEEWESSVRCVRKPE